MGKQEVVQAQVTAVQATETQALTDAFGNVWDLALAAAGAGTVPQDQIDQAVAKALADAHAQNDQAMASLQQSLADMTAKEQLEASALTDVNAQMAKLQQTLDAIKALVAPAPVA